MTLYSEQGIRDVAERAYRLGWNASEEVRDALRIMVACNEPFIETDHDFSDLFARGLLHNVSDMTGEQVTCTTDAGARFLLRVVVDKLGREEWLGQRDMNASSVLDQLKADGIRGVVVE